MNINPKLFGERLEKFRNEKDLKQEDLASIIGTSYSRIGRIERNVSDAEVTFMELHRLITHFDLSPEALMLRCEFIKRKREPGIATKIIKLFDEIKKEYEGEQEE